MSPSSLKVARVIHYVFRRVNHTAALPVSVGGGESQDN